MTPAGFTISVDQIAEAAYVRFMAVPVHHTVAHSSAINIDMDEFNVVIGIEVLDLAADLPFEELLGTYHVEQDKVGNLKFLEPSIKGFIAGSGTLTRSETSAVTDRGAVSATC